MAGPRLGTLTPPNPFYVPLDRDVTCSLDGTWRFGPDPDGRLAGTHEKGYLPFAVDGPDGRAHTVEQELALPEAANRSRWRSRAPSPSMIRGQLR